MIKMGTSPNLIARIGGLLYLTIIVISLFSEAFVRSKLVVSGDGAATTNNIIASIDLWRASVAGGLISLLCAIGLAFVLYFLLKRVNRNLALLVVGINLVSITLEGANQFNLFVILALLEDPYYLELLHQDQLYAKVSYYLVAYSYVFGASLAVYGCRCIIIGYLIFHSEHFPKILGGLMSIAGACYITNTFAAILSPTLASLLFPVILIPSLIAESSFCLWLIVKGANAKIDDELVQEEKRTHGISESLLTAKDGLSQIQQLEKNNASEWLIKVQAYIADNLTDKNILKVGLLAQHMGCKQVFLAAKLKQLVGANGVKSYMKDYRLELAHSKLLTESVGKLEFFAQEFGFTRDEFSRAYKKKYLKNPSDTKTQFESNKI